MSVINDTWRFLVQRRLWPVAILLIAAAVAVPKLLAKEPTAAPVPPAAVVKSDSASRAGDRADRGPRARTPTAAVAVRSSASRKNPFKPQATPTPDSQAEGDRPPRKRRTTAHDRDRDRSRRRRPSAARRPADDHARRRPRRSTSSTS